MDTTKVVDLEKVVIKFAGLIQKNKFDFEDKLVAQDSIEKKEIAANKII